MALALPLLALAQATAMQPPVASPHASIATPQCVASKSQDIVICGKARHSYRIDPNVLQAERVANALPDRVQVRDPDQYAQCVGPNCGGDFIPIIPIAEKLVIAGIDAASGNDWRQNFRTHPDEYAAYQAAKAKQSRAGFSLSVSVGNAR